MKLVVITGANGALGKSYIERFSCLDNYKCVAIARSKTESKHRNVTYIDNIDLLDTHKVKAEIDKRVPIDGCSEILFIHPVGRFKFERWQRPEADNDKDGIDDEIYASNYTTFSNVEEPLSLFASQEGNIDDLVLCGFGSVSDRYKVPFWLSYSKAKDVLRQNISTLARQNEKSLKVRGVFINVSSVNTENENKLRPNADKTNWLYPGEIVDDSFDILTQKQRIRNLEMDIFKCLQGFNPDVYYSPQVVWERWMQEMGEMAK